MSSLPPEIERARELLGQVAPRPGSKERIYWRITSKAQPRGVPRPRVAIIAVGLLGSATAMGLGLHWVAQTAPSRPPGGISPIAPQPAPKLPRRQSEPSAAPPIRQTEPTTTSPALDPAGNRLRKAPVQPAVAAFNGVPKLQSVAALPDVPDTSPQLDRNPAPSELSQQVADYRAAVAQLRGNPEAALQQLTAQRSRWPNSAILHEVDLRIIEALVRLGRRSQAVEAAQLFLRRYPDSARAPEVRRIIESNQ